MIPPRNQQAPHPGFWRRNLHWVVLLTIPLVALEVIFIIGLASSHSSGAEAVSYRQFIAQVKDHNVASVTLTNNSVVGTFNRPVRSDQVDQTGTKFSTTIPSTNENTVSILYNYGVEINVVNDNTNGISTLVYQWMPILLLAAPLCLILVGGLALYLTGRPRPRAEHTLA